MARRSIWDHEDKTQQQTESGWDTAANRDVSTILPSAPVSILDQLRVAEPKRKTVRNRSWERNNQNKPYRKVPIQIRDTVNEIAGAYGYSASQIAQAFLEYALMCYRRDDFELELELTQSGLTLIPGGWSAERKPIWAENAWPKQPTKKKPRRKKSGTPLYKQRAHYRLSPDLIVEIESICKIQRNADDLLISRKYHDGEVVTRFLTFSIEAYNAGNLTLQDLG